MPADDKKRELTEEQKAFFARHAHEARRDPTKDFWWMQPLCPPTTLDALVAFRQLHQELQQWVTNKGRRYESNIELWDAGEAKRRGRTYGSSPLAQIVWLTGPLNWPAELLMGRSYSGKIFMHQEKRYFFEPADELVLSLSPLD